MLKISQLWKTRAVDLMIMSVIGREGVDPDFMVIPIHQF